MPVVILTICFVLGFFIFGIGIFPIMLIVGVIYSVLSVR
jgi:hypothetical protein